MKNASLLNFTFIANFRGGTYCSQVQSTDVNQSIIEWITQISEEQNQIKYVGNKVIEELKRESSSEDNKFVSLNGLKNVWYTIYSTKLGSFHIHIIQTDMQ